MTVEIELVNDNVPVLMLDGIDRVINFSTVLFEGQPYRSDPDRVRLSQVLTILDDDVGEQVLIEANVTILDGKQKKYHDFSLPPLSF